MVYVELWFDAEKDLDWKITLWQIRDYDFDPLTAPYITLDINTTNEHQARKIQLDIVRDLKNFSVVVANAYMDRSRFQIRPRWYEFLLSPLGRITNESQRDKQAPNISSLRQTYTIWFNNQGGTTG